MTPSNSIRLTLTAAAVSLLMAHPAAHAKTATIETASGNGAGLILSATLLGTSVATASLPGSITVLGNTVPVNAGTAAVGSTTSGTPYNVTGSVANLNLTGTTALAIPAHLLPVTPSPLSSTVVNAKTSLSASVLNADTSFSDGTLVKSYGGVEKLNLGSSLSATTGIAGITLKKIPLFSLGLTADALQSSSQISMINGLLYGTNTLNSFTNVSLNLSSLVSLSSLSLLGSTLSKSINLSAIAGATPMANTTLSGATGSFLTSLGIRLTLNEQFNTCTSLLTSCSVETNALHLMIDPAVAGLAAMDLKLGHSYAAATASAVSAVPEPETYAMLGLGLVAVMFGARRQRRASGQA
ncbi:PEP-CTERM sorting domain-containing protein [Actimicrobium sp. CCC2.4]|uniref:PEP-CTERM sorting domain-containing protein n=1 Tax=Actimicrobium sp. CCC2.4 TaxID=3048606 RepID=UPI002AC8E5DE|nr:PEP-CTERM sorting domain-containing protein [Actimicrobium sp. CCC2.4]MEB0133741.1 PEP-CTERM sorting domain-containing protein [Actimicrobium sp. CCC2.4]WPX31287.1 PEP-CTERM sorting domain-containing protein [Actimicrobium sp. CCC2.4]